MGKGRGQQDPFATYIEWAQHRYNPGHYLGGTIEPHLRKSALGPRARRRSGLMLGASGLGWVALRVIAGGDLWMWLPPGFRFATLVLESAFALLLFSAGVTLYRSARPSRRGLRAPRR